LPETTARFFSFLLFKLPADSFFGDVLDYKFDCKCKRCEEEALHHSSKISYENSQKISKKNLEKARKGKKKMETPQQISKPTEKTSIDSLLSVYAPAPSKAEQETKKTPEPPKNGEKIIEAVWKSNQVKGGILYERVSYGGEVKSKEKKK
jgi:hypothetical protein